MTRLPNDVSRCTGERDGEACPDRETCRRYLDRERASSPWVNHINFYKPMNLLGCMDKIEVVKPDEKEKRK